MRHKKIKLSFLVLFGLGLTTLQAQMVKDIDGNIYRTVTIGTQTWMAENLKTTKFNDGSAIPLVTDNTSWYNISKPGYCWYNNDEANYKVTYGALYNWHTINTGKLCLTGWHVPNDSEWHTLASYLGGDKIAGGKLKEADSEHWSAIDVGATNKSGFTALPGGYRGPKGEPFNGIGDYGYWWSIDTDSIGARNWGINYSDSSVEMSRCSKTLGISVRCVLGPTVFTTTPNIAAQKDGLQLSAGEHKPQDSVTIRNEAFRFEVTTPKSWSFRKIVQQDPYEEMRSGSYSSSISGGEGEKEPENWNGFKLISTDESNNPTPFVIIYGHKVFDQNPEEFANLFESSLAGFGIKEMNLNRAFSVGDAKGFDCTYGLGLKIRYTALYQNGIRVVIMYYFPSSDPTLFEKYAPEVDKVIKSLRIK